MSTFRIGTERVAQGPFYRSIYGRLIARITGAVGIRIHQRRGIEIDVGGGGQEVIFDLEKFRRFKIDFFF